MIFRERERKGVGWGREGEREGGERERERERSINLLFHLLLRSLIALVCVLTGDQTCHLGVPGQRSNQLDYMARAGGPIFFLKILFHLFLERGEGREKERERNINMWLPLACPLLGLQPRHVP